MEFYLKKFWNNYLFFKIKFYCYNIIIYEIKILKLVLTSKTLKFSWNFIMNIKIKVEFLCIETKTNLLHLNYIFN